MTSAAVRCVVAWVAAWTLLGGGVAVAAPYEPDPTFGAGGLAEFSIGSIPAGGGFSRFLPDAIGGGGIAVAESIDHDGTTVVALAKVRSDGSRDPDFGRNGEVGVPIESENEELVGAVRQTSGRVVFLARDRMGHAELRGVTPNGAVDTTFHGQVSGGAEALAIDGLDRLLVGFDNVTGSHVAVQRLLSDGTVDRSFGEEGTATLPSALDGELLEIVTVPGSNRPVLSILANSDDRNLSIVRLAGDGGLDTEFGDGGVAKVFDLGRSALTARADGAVLVGSGTHLTQLTPAGAPDPSFGVNGTITFPLGYNRYDEIWDLAYDRALRPVVLLADSYDEVMQIRRFEPDGSADPTFGTAGASVGKPDVRRGRLALGPGETVFVTGSPTLDSDEPRYFDPAMVARFVAGTLDQSFDKDGMVAVQLGETTVDSAGPVGFDTAGRLLVVGTAASDVNNHGLVARVTQAGDLDDSYGDGGFTLLDSFFPYASAVAHDEITILGSDRGRVALTRIGGDGRPVTTFGIEGEATVDPPSDGSWTMHPRLAVDEQGRTLVGASAGTNAIAIGRTTVAGTPDMTWGTSGWTVVPTHDLSFPDIVGIYALPGGGAQLVIATDPIDYLNGGPAFTALVRLNSAGVPDQAFGEGGVSRVTAVTGLPTSAATRLPDGSFVLVSADTVRLWVTRVDADGHPDARFGDGGTATLVLWWDFNLAGVAADADGRLVLSGTKYDYPGRYRPALLRLDPSGNRDESFGVDGLVVAPPGVDGYAGAPVLLNQTVTIGVYALVRLPKPVMLVRFAQPSLPIDGGEAGGQPSPDPSAPALGADETPAAPRSPPPQRVFAPPAPVAGTPLESDPAKPAALFVIARVVSVRSHGGSRRVRVAGRLWAGSGQRATACHGTVQVRLRLHGHEVLRRTVPMRHGCSFATTGVVRLPPRTPVWAVRVHARFSGSPAGAAGIVSTAVLRPHTG